MLAGLIGLVIIIISSIAKGSVMDEAMLIETLVSEIPILVITGGLMIPLQLKFGPEKSRIVLMLVIGVVLIAGYIISKSAYVSTMIEQVRKLLDGNVPIQLLALLIATLVIITVISVLATSKIMNVKEF